MALRDGRCEDAAVTPTPHLRSRSHLVHVAHVLAYWQANRSPRRQYLEDRLKDLYELAGHVWDGGRDITWLRDDLRRMRDTEEMYPPAAYYRWRVGGLPMWAAFAAGMHLTRDPVAYQEERAELRRRQLQMVDYLKRARQETDARPAD